ncbi:MAG: ATP-binding cassette domain-containing protein [Steroidobacteraceae bacterium]
MHALSVHGLVKTYRNGVQALKGIDLDVEQGECFGLLGPNGAGKTTTLRCCLGLTEPDAGDIRLAGLPVPAQAREARYRVGVVPQFDNLDPDFTVTENLVVYGRYFGIPAAAVRARVPQLLEFAGLADKAQARIEALSGGMKRRLTIARALVNDPQVIFMDEPTTGLDPQARHLIWDRLKSLLVAGRTLVLTTHFMDEAERLCGRVGIMDKGELIALDAPQTLIEREIEPQVVEVFGEGVREWVEAAGRGAASRIEVAGETAFCYTHDAAALLATLDGRPALRALRRAANLEDVFIKLTGRDIRD